MLGGAPFGAPPDLVFLLRVLGSTSTRHGLENAPFFFVRALGKEIEA